MDATITSEKDFWYYDHVSRTMGLPSSSLDDFYRLFRISGLSEYLLKTFQILLTASGHCVGGDGAHNIGQRGSDVGPKMDTQHNIVQAIVEWVENGRAPDTITGVKYINDVSLALFKCDRRC